MAIRHAILCALAAITTTALHCGRTTDVADNGNDAAAGGPTSTGGGRVAADSGANATQGGGSGLMQTAGAFGDAVVGDAGGGTGDSGSPENLDASVDGDAGGTGDSGSPENLDASVDEAGQDATSDRAAALACWADAGVLAPEAKACQTNADCEPLTTQTCCGPGPIIGLRRGSAFGACYASPRDCGPVGCASHATAEDNGPIEGSGAPYGVLARCATSPDDTKRCTTVPCTDHVTACSTGETCQNGCMVPCTCEDGVFVCPKPPPPLSSCTKGSYCTYRASRDAAVAQTCSCGTLGFVCQGG